MSNSSPRSSSSASRRRATKRPKVSTSRNSARSLSKKQLRQPAKTRKLSTKAQSLGNTQARQTKPSTKSQPNKLVIGAIAVGVLALVSIVVVLVLSHMPVFVIEGIDATGTEHVSAQTVAKLANIEEGTTLLSLDASEIEENVKRNPWVKSVSISREFPSTLGISVEEREVGAIVIIGAGASVWSIGTDGIWIEPVQLDTTMDLSSAALARAQELGCLLIADVPASVDPAQGSATTDDTIQAVLTYQDELPDDIVSQARVYYASSEGSISLVLDSGLEISLGAPEDINAKSQALTEIMAHYPNQLTYINVRVASKPTYRKVPDGTTISDVSAVVASNAAQAAETSADTASEQGEGSQDDSQDSDVSSDGESVSDDTSTDDSGSDSE